ncbi:hypothetical protein ES332_A08G057700v1 [Gossypium tomentosum]|uniref:RPM1 interacting protein 13 n=1 Tax=Gossypium tomentosum TaxID=34277 RepID=A0A5D2PAZ0_GOSTO|nr:hypothetical protein ES332_A08G057700v1 [Gossypium tomentosum]
MESNPVVFDISSDDDDEVASGLEESKGDDYDWFSEVLEAVSKGFDDSDEVVVIGEVNPNKKSKTRSSSVRKDVTLEDDDCIVLEGDPEKAVSDVNDYHDDSDELLVVGHKGQIACRDFPHPRHDCAKFPFSSTSHDQHCELCHCFVCDVRAPCCYWGLGISNTDHCHATNKEEIWSTLRKNFRHGRNVSMPPVTSHSTIVPQHNQALHRDIIRLTTQNHVSRPTPVRPSGNCIPQNNVPRPSIIRACSSSTRHGVPYNPTVGSRHVLNRSTIQLRSGSQELLGVRNSVIQRDRGSTNGEGPFKVNGGDKSYYNELESLLLDNQCAPGGSLTAGLNAPSPDHIPLETGFVDAKCGENVGEVEIKMVREGEERRKKFGVGDEREVLT